MWNGEKVPPKQTLPDYILRHPGQACLTRDPVPWGGKVRLPQRPEVSSKQALSCLCRTDFGSPYIIHANLREPLEPKPVLNKNV